jgi:hypothetical protein
MDECTIGEFSLFWEVSRGPRLIFLGILNYAIATSSSRVI